MTEHYTVTKDADRLAPQWLASRINYTTIKFLYRDIDGHAELKGVRIGDEVARIGDTVQFNGKKPRPRNGMAGSSMPTSRPSSRGRWRPPCVPSVRRYGCCRKQELTRTTSCWKKPGIRDS